MIKINYIKPEESESKDDISEFNIKESFKYKKNDYLEMSCLSWLKIDSKRDYQDLEMLLRKLNLDCYIIAQTITTIPEGLEINYPNEKEINEPLNYIAKILCKPLDEVLKEILSYHSSCDENMAYETNFEYLKKTGCLMTIKKEIDSNEKENISKVNGVEEIKKVLSSELKLDFTIMKPIDSINVIIDDLNKNYGKKPEKIVCGEINENKVYALVLDGEIKSPIGWIEKNQKNDNLDIEYELIDFRTIKIENNY